MAAGDAHPVVMAPGAFRSSALLVAVAIAVTRDHVFDSHDAYLARKEDIRGNPMLTRLGAS